MNIDFSSLVDDFEFTSDMQASFPMKLPLEDVSDQKTAKRIADTFYSFGMDAEVCSEQMADSVRWHLILTLREDVEGIEA